MTIPFRGDAAFFPVAGQQTVDGLSQAGWIIADQLIRADRTCLGTFCRIPKSNAGNPHNGRFLRDTTRISHHALAMSDEMVELEILQGF